MKRTVVLLLICIVFCAGCAKKVRVISGLMIIGSNYFVEISSKQKDIDKKYYDVVRDIQSQLIQWLKDNKYNVVGEKSKADIVLSLYMEETTPNHDNESVFRAFTDKSYSVGPSLGFVGLIVDTGRVVASSIKKGLNYIPRTVHLMCLEVFEKNNDKYVYRGELKEEYCNNRNKFVKFFIKQVVRVVDL